MVAESRLNHLLSMLDDGRPDEFVLYAIAQEYIKAGDDQTAISYFQKLIDVNHQYVGLYYHLAAAHARQDEIEKAFSVYDEGIRIASNLNDQHALAELKNARLNFELEL